ncbi:hypothetical protein SAMN05216377_12441 [Pseudonocardia oroxyli]|uniref:Uncharacterized protein n=1 Tax=Pseudonocardia oroxyli TaxID=366584 RepID=A0A1G8D2K4_PSEOR|nr:hypothetical protein SAMN05216377_12441 [Pseudonocardia oroxyli]
MRHHGVFTYVEATTAETTPPATMPLCRLRDCKNIGVTPIKECGPDDRVRC